MLLHQDGSIHQWVPGCQWDLIVTMDDATSEHYSMVFVEQDMDTANRYLREQYLPAFNAEFMQPAMEEGTSFVPCDARQIEDILCEHFDRVVGKDNCVSFEGIKLQIPQDRVLRYPEGDLAVFHGPRLLARFTADGQPFGEEMKKAA